MDIDLNDEQDELKSAIERLLGAYRNPPNPGRPTYFERSAALDGDLRESGFLDIARQDGLGAIEATLLVEEVARLPYVSEITASALVAPMIGLPSTSGPVVLAGNRPSDPLRFLAGDGVVLFAAGQDVRAVPFVAADVEEIVSSYGYPYGRLRGLGTDSGDVVAGGSADLFRTWWQIGLSFEIIGAMQSAFDLTLQYVKDRRQFDRPLGAFQTIQHRLSECATLLHGARLLARRAAWSGEATDGAVAAAYAQDTATRMVYETHQFHGAIGLTLEYPLHLWTYRLRVLIGELGGPHQQLMQCGDAIPNKADLFAA